MSETNTQTAVTIECHEKEHHDILSGCQAAIFRDIWRLTDADAALKMFITLQNALPADLDRSDTPKLNTLASWLREAPDIMRYLEFTIQNPSTSFALLRFQAEHNRRAAEFRAAKAAEEAAAHPAEEEAAV